MAREFGRTERLADYLRQELATLIQRELRDPRLGMVSVNEVEVSRDLAHAKVFVTVLGKDSADDAAEAVEVLNKASGLLRSMVAKGTRMRTVPRIRFVFDAGLGRGRMLSDLIDRARADDRERHQPDDIDDDRNGASPDGEA